ncbi:MAG: hypothetical protein U0271_26550 [Polyangiaceae bacterium]
MGLRPLSCALLASTMTACASNPSNAPEPSTSSSQEVVLSSLPASSAPRAVSSAPAPDLLDEDAPLTQGRVAFSGMVLPIKGGYEVRGVDFDERFAKRLADSSVDGKPTDPDWFLGAIVKVVAELEWVEAPLSLGSSSGPVAQQSSRGSFWRVVKLETVELLANAATIEGTLTPSKGFYQVDRYLVTESDLAWSLVGSGGPREGVRVKLWGQPRTVSCKPGAQCLTTGSLPMFRVARASVLR